MYSEALVQNKPAKMYIYYLGFFCGAEVFE